MEVEVPVERRPASSSSSSPSILVRRCTAAIVARLVISLSAGRIAQHLERVGHLSKRLGGLIGWHFCILIWVRVPEVKCIYYMSKNSS